MKNTRGKIKKSTYLADSVGHTEHAMCSTPADIAVKRNFEWVLNAAFNLENLKCFDTLTRRMDLWQLEVREQSQIYEDEP